MIFSGMIYNPLSVYAAPILAEFPEFTRAQYAMTMTIMSIVCAVANMFLGKLKQLINTRGIVTLGGVLMTVGLFIYSKSTSLGMFYVAAIVVGIAFAFLATAICGTIINTWFAKHTGMLVGANTRPGDIELNVCKAKHLTSIRNAADAEDAMRLHPVRPMTLERAIDFIDDDELVEITPKNIRMRKKILDSTQRYRSKR